MTVLQYIELLDNFKQAISCRQFIAFNFVTEVLPQIVIILLKTEQKRLKIQ